MRKYHFLSLLGAFALGFLLIQLVTFWTVEESLAVCSQRVVIEVFLRVCAAHGIPVIILEPEVVRHYTGLGSEAHPAEPSMDHHRALFCENGDRHWCLLTTFGVLESQKNGLSAELFKAVGFEVQELDVFDPRLSGAWISREALRTSHLILQLPNHDSHLVHLVVLLEIPDGDGDTSYLWHCPVFGPDDQLPAMWKNRFSWKGDFKLKGNFKLEDLHFGRTAEAFDRLNTRNISENGFDILLPENLLPQLESSTFLECDLTRTMDFYSANRKALEESENSTFVWNAVTVMQKGREILTKLQVPFWLSSGNCLGWFRQCGVIPYSEDVDFGIFITDNDERIIPAFQGGGFTLKHIFGRVSDSYELSFYHVETGVKLDLFFFYKEADYMWNGGTDYITGKKYKYVFPPFTMCWANLYNRRFRIPCETQSYVEANYGVEWWKPVRSWDWKSSPPNVRENGEWSDEEWDEVVQVYDNVRLEDIGLKFNS